MSGACRENRPSENTFRQGVWGMLPGLANCLWYGQHLAEEAVEYSRNIRKALRKMEDEIAKENPKANITEEKEEGSEVIAAFLRRMSPEEVAKMFHGTYERLAVQMGYETREASRVEWDNVPEKNKKLMIATVKEILDMLVVSQIGDKIGMP